MEDIKWWRSREYGLITGAAISPLSSLQPYKYLLAQNWHCVDHHPDQPKLSPAQAVSDRDLVLQRHAAVPKASSRWDVCVWQPDHLSARNDQSHFMSPGMETNSLPLTPKYSNSKRQCVQLNCESKMDLFGKEFPGFLGLDSAVFSGLSSIF